MTSIVCVGEAMVELSLSDLAPDTADVGIAGDTFNTAVYLKRAASDLRVAYATKLGQDKLSDRILAAMSAEGLDTDLIQRDAERRPGLYAITTDDKGERSFTYWRETSAARHMFAPPGLKRPDLGAFDMLYLSAITLAILPDGDRRTLLNWLAEYRRGGGRVAFDSNYRPALWDNLLTARSAVEAAWRQTDIALPSVDDEMMLFADPGEDAVVARLQSWGVRSGALKRGSLGPRALDGTEATGFASAPQVVDSTAAGDSFNGGYLAGRLAGAPEVDCLHAGHALASRVIGHRGAILPRPAA